MDHISPSRASDLDRVFARLCLAGDQVIAETARTETEVVLVLEVRDTDTVHEELVVESEICSVEVRPVAENSGQLFGDDRVLSHPFPGLAGCGLDLNQVLDRVDQVNVAGSGDVEVTCGFAEVQVAAGSLVR